MPVDSLSECANPPTNSAQVTVSGPPSMGNADIPVDLWDDDDRIEDENNPPVTGNDTVDLWESGSDGNESFNIWDGLDETEGLQVQPSIDIGSGSQVVEQGQGEAIEQNEEVNMLPVSYFVLVSPSF